MVKIGNHGEVAEVVERFYKGGNKVIARAAISNYTKSVASHHCFDHPLFAKVF